jgi:hypothetical protein
MLIIGGDDLQAIRSMCVDQRACPFIYFENVFDRWSVIFRVRLERVSSFVCVCVC